MKTMKAKDLKNALLQEAVQGKLVPQIAAEGNAADLLNAIRKEKAELIKAGKIKKEKPLPPITDDEKPFDIPESWCWCRLGDVCTDIADIDHRMPPVTENGIPYISPLNFGKDGSIDYAGAKKISIEDFKQLSKKCKPERGDIIFPRYGTIGVLRKIETDIDFLVSYSCATIKPHLKNVCANYVFYVLCSHLIQKTEIQRYINKTTQPNVGLQSIKQFLFPLPPLSEQKRIVSAIEQFMPLIDEYGKKEEVLSELNAAIGGQAKKALLQEAVQGKLVPQIAAEGNAADLLKQIQAEKAQLIKAGKLKKEKPLPPITDDEKPFDIPESWCWCRLGDVGDWKAGSTPSRSNPLYYDGNIPWLKTGDLNDSYINEIPECISELALDNCSMRLNPIGSVLIAMYGATIGKVGILNVEATTNQACCACIPIGGLYNKYLFYYLISQKSGFAEKAEGGAQPNISREKIVAHLFPLPPLSEQKRIVSALEKMLPLCERLGK